MTTSRWHVSYQNRNNTVMELADCREDAIALAHALMEKGFAIHSVGSMADGIFDWLDEAQLKRLPARRADPAVSR